MTEIIYKSVEPSLEKSVFEDRYGVLLHMPNQDKLQSMVDDLLAQRTALNGLAQSLNVTSIDRVVSFVPCYVLSETPSAEQVKLFNTDNTQQVATYTVDIQANLENVPISESGERMVHIPAFLATHDVDASFSETTFHEACGQWAGKPREFYARDSFARRLMIMGKMLNKTGIQLHFEDAFRPVGVQEGLFKRRIAWTQADNPDWTDEEVIREAKSKTAVKPRLASHKGGAAVDALLQDMSTGEILDFGHNYPDGGALVFPQTTFITEEQWLNRQRFQVAAALSDLTLYVGEDWHLSYGDNLASLNTEGKVDPDYTAQYGPIKDFNRQTGQITSYYSSDEIDAVFDF